MLRARRDRPCHCRAAKRSDELAPSHAMEIHSISLSASANSTPSSPPKRPLRCDISTWLRTAVGQKHALPHCNSNGWITSISGHKTANSVWRDGTGAQESQCRPADTSSVLPEPFEPIRCQRGVAHRARSDLFDVLAHVAYAWPRRWPMIQTLNLCQGSRTDCKFFDCRIPENS